MTVPRLHVHGAAGGRAELRIAGDRAHYLRNVLRLREGAEPAAVQRRGRRMAGDRCHRCPACGGVALVERCGARAGAGADAGIRADPAQPAGLADREGGRAGRRSPGADPDPADRGPARGLGAAGRDRRRGCRAVRAADGADDRPAASVGGLAGRARAGPTPLLFADERGAGRRWAARCTVPARDCWWARRAASPEERERCSQQPGQRRSASGPGSCGPRRLRSTCWRPGSWRSRMTRKRAGAFPRRRCELAGQQG